MVSLGRKVIDGRAMLMAGLATGGLAFIICLGFLCWSTPGPIWWATLLPGVSLICGVIGAEAERWPLTPPARPDDNPDGYGLADPGHEFPV